MRGLLCSLSAATAVGLVGCRLIWGGPYVVRLAPGDDIAATVGRALAQRGPSQRLDVVLEDGVYEMTRTLELAAEDSGVTIRARHPGKATIVGGRAFRGADFVAGPANAWPIVSRLKPDVRTKALTMRVPETLQVFFEHGRHQGGGQWTYTNFDKYGPNPGKELRYPTYPILSVDCKRMEPARWPNKSEGYFWPGATNIVRKPSKGVPALVRVPGGRADKWWIKDQNVAAAGFINGCTYLDCCCRVDGFLKESNAVEVVTDAIREETSRLYFFNLLEELDAPGEWCYDRRSKSIVLYPPEGFSPDSLCAIGFVQEPLFHITGNDVALQGLVFTAKIGHPAVIIEKGSGNLVQGCRFAALGYDGVFLNGRRNVVRDCDFTEITATPVVVQGGVLKTMERGDNLVDNCRIRDYAILQTTWAKGGVYMDGVGNRVAHCDIAGSVECGLYYAGYDNVVEYCRIRDVLREFDDGGVVYSPGGARSYGNVFRYNDLSGSPGECIGYYLDDTTSGHTAYGNVIRDCGSTGILIGGGRDNVISNNLVIAGYKAVAIDNRGLYWPSYTSTSEEKMRESMKRRLGYTNDEWRVFAHYPKLRTWLEDESVPLRSYADNAWVNNVFVDPAGFDSVKKFAKNRTIPDSRLTYAGNLCVRTRGPLGGPCDVILHPELMPTNEYSVRVDHALPIGKTRLLDGTPERPIDLGFADLPGPRYDPWPYFTKYCEEAWIENPVLHGFRRQGLTKALKVAPYRKGDLTLKQDARLLKELPAFEPIPFKDIGLYVNDWRKDVD